MNYDDPPPADPTVPHASYPSSPPELSDAGPSSSQHQRYQFASTPSGIPILPRVSLKFKIARPTPNSAHQIMASASFNDDEHEMNSGDDSFQFSGVNANAVRNQLNNESSGASEAAADNSSTGGDEEPAVVTTPKKELRERKRVSDGSASTSAVKKSGGKSGGKKRGRKAKGGARKAAKKEEDEEEEEEHGDEDDEAEANGDDGEDEEEVYEVERILSHGWSDDGVLLFKVKWVGYGSDFDTFEPVEMLSSAKQRIEEYKRSLPIEDRAELENGSKKKEKKRKGRPSKAAATTKSASKRARSSVSLQLPSDESEAEEKHDDDDDFEPEKAGPSTSTTRTRGRRPTSKGELKMFASPTTASPPKKRPFLQSRQGWLDESDSNSEVGSEADKKRKEEEKKKEKRVTESPAPAPKRETGRKRGTAQAAAHVEETTIATNGTRHTVSSSRSVPVVEGMYRHENGEVDVVISEGRSQRVVPLREAHEMTGFGLVQFLADRFQFH